MSTFNVATKILSSVIQSGVTSTLVVAADTTFKGQISGYQVNGSGYLVLRQTNVSGVRLVSSTLEQNISNVNESMVAQSVELGAGTYFLSIEGAPLNAVVAFSGTVHANTL